MQNRRAARQPQTYPIDTIQLDTAAPAATALRLLAAPHSRIDMQSGNAQTAQTAHRLALEALAMVAGHLGLDVLPAALTVHSEAPVLLYANDGYTVAPAHLHADDGYTAAVVWECHLTDPAQNTTVQLWLDDETGTMLAFSYAGAVDAASGEQATPVSADAWAQMCVQYYGFQSGKVLAQAGADAGPRQQLVFTGADGQTLALAFEAGYRHTTVQPGTAPSEAPLAEVRFNMPD